MHYTEEELDAMDAADEASEREAIRKALALQDEINLVLQNMTMKECVACSGSGYYDNDGSPNCDSCKGTGKDMDSVSERKIDELIRQAFVNHDDSGYMLRNYVEAYMRATCQKATL